MTISEEYRKQQQELHKKPKYGVASEMYAPVVAQIMARHKPKTVSDYGAGKKRLQTALATHGVGPFSYFPYDPAFPEYGDPTPAELVCCIDVLEHIEAEYLDDVIAELNRLVEKIGFFTVDTGPARKVLPDGRNAHLIQKSSGWWLQKFSQYFDTMHLQMSNDHSFWMIVTPIKTPE